MPNDTNPETGVITDVDSAVKALTSAPPEADTDEDETEAPQEAQGEGDEPEPTEAETEDADGTDEATEDADEDDGAEDAPDDEPGRKYTVKVNGQEYEVTLDDLRNGYQMGADYHRKTADLAEQRRALEAEKQQNEQLRGLLEAELSKYAQAEDQEPDWVKLANDLDPWEFQQKQAAWAAKQRQRQEAQRAAYALAQQRHQQALMENGRKLVEAFPEWKGNPQKFEEDRNRMLATAREFGYSDKEFYDAIDHRVFNLLKYAMIGKEAATAKAKPLDPAKKVPKKAPKVMKPGASETRATRDKRDKAALRENLRKRGDIDSAVEFLLGGG